MQANDWAPEHCKALQDYLALGMSFAEIAREINARFGTAYTRNAAIGRSKRMKLTAPRRPAKLLKPRPQTKAQTAVKSHENRTTKPAGPVPAAAQPVRRPDPVKLRCVGISPRLVSFAELEPSDCRYPYGGDKENEPISFCGHPQLPGSSYCAPHFHLTRGPGTESERAVAPVVLRLVLAA
ncbi:MAG TPA: GcrA family cell cycle regulator [Bradyrhizobium sp.]|nr:GcrA family cell cycle regulator [Bradyrhizobium sp.]